MRQKCAIDLFFAVYYSLFGDLWILSSTLTHCFSASRVITAITITVITVFTEGVSEGKENVKCNLTIYIYKYIIYIVSSGMRKRKVFRETVITVIVIGLWWGAMVCDLQSYGGKLSLKLWFVICKATVSLFQNYELGLLTGFGIWGCWKSGLITPWFLVIP